MSKTADIQDKQLQHQIHGNKIQAASYNVALLTLLSGLVITGVVQTKPETYRDSFVQWRDVLSSLLPNKPIHTPTPGTGASPTAPPVASPKPDAPLIVPIPPEPMTPGVKPNSAEPILPKPNRPAPKVRTGHGCYFVGGPAGGWACSSVSAN